MLFILYVKVILCISLIPIDMTVVTVAIPLSVQREATESGCLV